MGTPAAQMQAAGDRLAGNRLLITPEADKDGASRTQLASNNTVITSLSAKIQLCRGLEASSSGRLGRILKKVAGFLLPRGARRFNITKRHLSEPSCRCGGAAEAASTEAEPQPLCCARSSVTRQNGSCEKRRQWCLYKIESGIIPVLLPGLLERIPIPPQVAAPPVRACTLRLTLSTLLLV